MIGRLMVVMGPPSSSRTASSREVRLTSARLSARHNLVTHDLLSPARSRPGSRRLVRARGVAAAGGRRRGAGRHGVHGHRLRLRPRPRPLAVRRPGRGQPGPLVEADHRLLLPGTRLGRARGTIKVLITADKKDVVVDARDGLRLTRLTGRKAFVLAKVRPKATRWRIMPRGSRSVVSYRAPGRGGWQKWTTFPGAAEFSAGNQPLTLRLPKHGSAEYRGALRSVEKHTVNVLPIDRYVQGVVPREVPAEWPAQAVRAQAVAARTYAAFERETATSYYDICDTESCQVYGGVADEHPAANAAVKATARQGRALPGPAGLHPVLLEQRRLQLGRLAALPGRAARSLRGLLGQPQRPVDRHRHAARRSRRPGPRSAPSTTCRSAGTASVRTSAAGSPRSRSPAAWVACPPRSRSPATTSGSGSGSSRPGSSWRRGLSTRRAPAPGRRRRRPGCRRSRAAPRSRRPAR